MRGTVRLVLAIDTEGPATDPRHPELLSNWTEVDRFLAKVFCGKFRARVLDSRGGGLIIGWFILSWTGFTANPVNRDCGYHRIYDHYIRRWGETMKTLGDGVYWHYHHPAPSGIANEWCTAWSANQEYYNVLNHLVIDRGYFPAVFRAGGTIETNEVSNWLEQWIPFDYSNRSGAVDWDARDSNGVRRRDICDWSRAPADWSWYHPSRDDYQRPGDMRRAIFRCVDLSSDVHSLKESDIEMAFAGAEKGQDTILATFDHDYRDRADLFDERLLKPLARVVSRYPSVRWRFANALQAAQSVMGYRAGRGPAFAVVDSSKSDALTIRSNRELFGPRPYVVCKYADSGEYVREEVTPLGGRAWGLPLGGRRRRREIGIAGSDVFGNVGVALYAWNGTRLISVKS